MKTIAFKTLGCKVNQYETEAMREQFLNSGLTEAPWSAAADCYLINTCTVTEKADRESRYLIRRARRLNPDAKIIVTGCYAELDSDEIKKIDPKVQIVKNSKKPEISSGIARFKGRTKAFVKAQDGCDNFCSYCKVPLVRGRSRSRPAAEIIREVNQLVANDYKEIILTGICLGDWGRAAGLKLNYLLDEIEKAVEGEYRIRLSSIEPWYVDENLLKKIASSDKICRHLHIPMQSGDDEILKSMGRNFKSADFMALISAARALMPEIAFTTDIMVGFPGETEGQFNNTLRVVDATRPSRAHIFPFSMREGTKARDFGEAIPRKVVKKRIKALKAATDKWSGEYRRQSIGRPARVLVETTRDKRTDLLTGLTDTYIRVAFQGPDRLKGRFRDLTLTNQNSYDILAAHLSGPSIDGRGLEGEEIDIGRDFPEGKLDRSINRNCFSQK